MSSFIFTHWFWGIKQPPHRKDAAHRRSRLTTEDAHTPERSFPTDSVCRLSSLCLSYLLFIWSFVDFFKATWGLRSLVLDKTEEGHHRRNKQAAPASAGSLLETQAFGPAPDPVNQLWEWGAAVCAHTSPPGGANAPPNWRHPCAEQGLSAAALLTFWPDSFLSWAVLCIVGCLTASLTYTHEVPVAPTSRCDNQKYF